MHLLDGEVLRPSHLTGESVNALLNDGRAESEVVLELFAHQLLDLSLFFLV